MCPSATLPPGVRSRVVDTGTGLAMHILEAGSDQGPCLVLLHGFPELAYSWRKVMGPLAAAGYYVVAPDQRGYGRTTGWDAAYDGDLDAFRIINLVRDVLGLITALNRRWVTAVVGHDFGSPVAAYCGVIRPDVFRSVVLMSAPFRGPPALAAPEGRRSSPASREKVFEELAELSPPRRHYQEYYRTRHANDDMLNARQGIQAFLRAYYHVKSGDWAPNRPCKLQAFAASELAKLPTYYVMELNKGMADTVATAMPSQCDVEACRWLTDPELAVYAQEFARTGFQGGLQWYRCMVGKYAAELQLFSGRTIDVPACFIAGKRDWGVYQDPGALESMERSACTQWRGTYLVDGAGHWVQQEQPEAVTRLLLDFLAG